MNPNSGEGAPQQQFEVPTPQENTPQSGEVSQDRALEAAAPDDSRAGKHQPQLPPIVATPVLTAPDDSQVTPDDTATSVTDTHHSASHGDVIERQWVDKAKAIVAQTKDDPHVQNSQMSQVKAEYIQKRFNKTIPTDKSVAA